VQRSKMRSANFAWLQLHSKNQLFNNCHNHQYDPKIHQIVII
jgi:hypothetical protein